MPANESGESVDVSRDQTGPVTDAPHLTDDLYHYTSADVGVDAILTQMRLRMGLIESTNDPRESRPHYPALAGGVEAGEPDLRSLWEEGDHLLRRSAKVSCLTLDYELPQEALDSDALRGWRTQPCGLIMADAIAASASASAAASCRLGLRKPPQLSGGTSKVPWSTSLTPSETSSPNRSLFHR